MESKRGGDISLSVSDLSERLRDNSETNLKKEWNGTNVFLQPNDVKKVMILL